MSKTKKSSKKPERDYSTEYSELFGKTNYYSSLNNIEWSNPGDTIKKFSLYEDYTPIKTSSETSLISNS